MELSKLRITSNVVAILVFGYVVIASLQFRSLAGYFPLAIASVSLILSVANLGLDVVKYRKVGSAILADEADEVGTATIRESSTAGERRAALWRMARYLAWTMGYAAAIWLIGMVVATPLFLFAFFLFDARTGWRFAVLGAAGATAALLLASDIMGLRWPESVLGLFT